MKKLRIFRVICGMSQRELAREIGCTQPLISMFETGKLIPGKSLRKAIAKALNKQENEVFPEKNS